jgi:hypothetical protein
MKWRGWLYAIVVSTGSLGLVWLSGASNANPAVPGSPPAVRTAKCTIDIAGGKESDCTLIKKSDEWIL